jgi:hypothetical protein
MSPYALPAIMSAAIVGGSTYALARGGAPERWGTAFFLVNVVGSNLAPLYSGKRFLTTETGIMAVDIVFMFVMIAMTLRAQRYWPMWIAALQLDAVLTHLMMFAKTTPPFSYGLALYVWGLPIPIMLAAGAWRHRNRMKKWGDDPAWN